MFPSIEVLFEDQWLLAVNKPSGLPTQPTLDRKRPDLYTRLQETRQWPYLGLHHRLDVPTSGLVLFTKDKRANKGVSELFQGRNLQKKYYCLVDGLPMTDEFELQNFLKAVKLKNGKTKVFSTHSGGDPAHTTFRLLKKYEHYSLIEASPHTGRMHQIRVHLAELGFPILGDSLYHRVDRRFPRLMLHAAQLHFIHPITKEPVVIAAPLPEDFGHHLKDFFGPK